MKQYITALRNQLATIASLKHIDTDWGQLNLEQPPVQYPCALLTVATDCDMLRDIINNQLLPRMERHGFPVSGLSFEWDYSVDYTPEQQMEYEKMIADRYEVDPQYFAEKYGMPVGAPKQNGGGLMAKEQYGFFV